MKEAAHTTGRWPSGNETLSAEGTSMHQALPVRAKTSAACLWLSLAAGLASSSGDVLAQALPGDHQARIQLNKLRGQNGG